MSYSMLTLELTYGLPNWYAPLENWDVDVVKYRAGSDALHSASVILPIHTVEWPWETSHKPIVKTILEYCVDSSILWRGLYFLTIFRKLHEPMCYMPRCMRNKYTDSHAANCCLKCKIAQMTYRIINWLEAPHCGVTAWGCDMQGIYP